LQNDLPAFVGGCVSNVFRGFHFVPQIQVRIQPILVDTAFAVVPDFFTARVAVAPVRIEFERKRVNVGGDIAGDVWVGVVAPGAAHMVCLFDDDKVADPKLAQLDGHAQSGHTGPEDGNAGGFGE